MGVGLGGGVKYFMVEAIFLFDFESTGYEYYDDYSYYGSYYAYDGLYDMGIGLGFGLGIKSMIPVNKEHTKHVGIGVAVRFMGTSTGGSDTGIEAKLTYEISKRTDKKTSSYSSYNTRYKTYN